jgi:hypothetical protein
VPHFIGIHNTVGGYVTFAMEPLCANGWNEASDRLSHDQKELVLFAWRKLHAKGILHNDPQLRHILISDDRTKVQIIDFQESRSLYPCEDVGLKACTRDEIDKEYAKVRELLDCDGHVARIRQRNNCLRRNWRRQCRREVKARTRRPPTYGRPGDIEDISDDEEISDDVLPSISDEDLRAPIEPEGPLFGRRFDVPDAEYREKVREKPREVEWEIQVRMTSSAVV